MFRAVFWVVLPWLIPDDGGSMHLWNVGRQSFYTAVQPRRQLWTSYSPPWELEISHVLAILSWLLLLLSLQSIFKDDKNSQHAFLQGEVKPSAQCHKILWHVKEPFKVWKRYFVRQNSSFPWQFLLLYYLMSAGRIARELWWMNQEFSPVSISPLWFSMLILTKGMNSTSIGCHNSES
jgi:hypothetical protein